MKYRKTTIILLDILMVLGILSNIGALVITNYLVVKEKPDAEFIEVNPVTAEVYDLKQAPKEERFGFLLAFGKQLIRYLLMGIALGVYVWMRQKAYHWRDYLVLSISVGVWFTILFMDFGSCFGYWLGSQFFQ